MSNIAKLEQFEGKLTKNVNAVVSGLVREITDDIQSKDYRRDIHLPQILGTCQQFEVDSPEINAPTMDDIAKTVHIISKLHSRTMYFDHRADSGLYATDYNMRVKLLHAMQNERSILELQISCVKAERAMQDALENKLPTRAPYAAITHKASD